VWDLDNEAAERAEKLGMAFARAATPGTDPRFAELVVELVREQVASAPVRKLSEFTLAGCTVNGAPCEPDCCEPIRRPTH
jgi:protoporphyrin/coproporphyrin ferrochelatase